MANEKKVEVVKEGQRVAVKIGLFTPFQIVGGNVYTFIDSARDNVSMVEVDRGIYCEANSRLRGPQAQAAKKFLVPWSNVSYVLYGEI
jgi:hypothetical protein